MKAVPGRQGAASKIPQGTAQGEGTQALRELVVVPAGREQQVTAARGLEIPRGRTRVLERNIIATPGTRFLFAMLPAGSERSLKQDSEMCCKTHPQSNKLLPPGFVSDFSLRFHFG